MSCGQVVDFERNPYTWSSSRLPYQGNCGDMSPSSHSCLFRHVKVPVEYFDGSTLLLRQGHEERYTGVEPAHATHKRTTGDRAVGHDLAVR